MITPDPIRTAEKPRQGDAPAPEAQIPLQEELCTFSPRGGSASKAGAKTSGHARQAHWTRALTAKRLLILITVGLVLLGMYWR